MSGEPRYLEDITRLASIQPHRGPASPGEKEAADYVAGRMTELGLNPVVEPFKSIPHFPMSWVLHSLFAIGACALAVYYPFIAIPILIFITVSFVGDSSTRFYLIRKILPRGPSQAVLGAIKATVAPKKVVYIAGHLDAGQMGFSLEPKGAERTVVLFQKYLGMQPPLLALIFYDYILNLLAALLMGLIGLNWGTGIFLGITAAIHLIPIVIFVPHEFAKICPGANDNGSGVAVMLELARRFKNHPLPNTELRFLGDGSEETYMHGMACYMNLHQHELDKQNTYFLIPESCGVGRPRVVVAEGVSWLEEHSPELCGALLVAARELGYTDVTPIKLRTGGTDASPPTVRGFKAAVIIAMNENDFVPNYHWTGDIPENIEVPTLEKVSNIFEATIKKIDQYY